MRIPRHMLNEINTFEKYEYLRRTICSQLLISYLFINTIFIYNKELSKRTLIK